METNIKSIIPLAAADGVDLSTALGCAVGADGALGGNFGVVTVEGADKVSVAALQATAAFAARTLLRIANDEQWPRMQRSKAEVARWKRENR